MPRHHFSFHTLLSELNPLQYIPVVGTLYRAITGNTIPIPVRDAGSMLFSGLIAGPVGLATEAGELAAEKLTGIDPEIIGDKVLAKLGFDHEAPSPTMLAKAAEPATFVPAPAPATAPATAPAPVENIAWSNAQLAAYGATPSTGGDLKLGSLQGSDVLNELELDRLQTQQAAAQYAAAAAITAS